MKHEQRSRASRRRLIRRARKHRLSFEETHALARAVGREFIDADGDLTIEIKPRFHELFAKALGFSSWDEFVHAR